MLHNAYPLLATPIHFLPIRQWMALIALLLQR